MLFRCFCGGYGPKKNAKRIPSIYPSISKIYPRYIHDIHDKYKIPSGSRPGPAQARPKPGAAHRPARLVFCTYLGYTWIHFWYFFSKGYGLECLMSYLSDFNLSGGCFGTNIIQNCTKWPNIGVHVLSFGPIFAKFQSAPFLL